MTSYTGGQMIPSLEALKFLNLGTALGTVIYVVIVLSQFWEEKAKLN